MCPIYCAIPLCFASDDNYAQYVATAIASILSNSKNDEHITFHIIGDDGPLGISEESKNRILNLKNIKDCEIIFYEADYKKYIEWVKKYKNYTKKTSVAAFYRLSIHSLMPKIDKILYLDSDIVVGKSLSDLFDIDVSKYLALAVCDTLNFIEYKKSINMIDINETYFNSGVMMLNNKMCIENGLEKKYEECFLKEYKKFKFIDQDILNKVLSGKVKFIDNKYNYFSINSGNIDDVVVIHYAGGIGKPNSEYCPGMNYLDLFWKYFAMTDWFLADQDNYIKIMEKQKMSDKIRAENIIKYKTRNEIVDSIAWFIPIRALRRLFRKKFIKN